jgi:hypothetical protein
METVPAEALAALDAAAANIEALDEAGAQMHFIRSRFGRTRNVRILLRDEQGRTIGELGLMEALDLLSA